MKNFIMIVDGEVVGTLPVPNLQIDGVIHPAVEKLVAILSSNPTIVASDEQVEEGSTWDGTSFTPPVE
jgi:hypothetical protein